MKKLSLAVLAAASLTFLATACGSSSSDSSGGGTTSASGSCSGIESSTQVCVEFGSAYTSSLVQQACTSQGLTYSSSGCTATGRIGRCTFTPSQGGAPMSYTAAFYSGDAASLQSACTQSNGVGGMTTTWTPN